MNYYNEWDKFAAEWLKELIKEGLIPKGEVDTRSIADVEPSDLKGFTQCHFFAGIGGWSRALQLAGWSPDRPVWTGSPPCQPFSTAGKQQGTDDERHLWPVWFGLVRECKPPIIFGEQVAAAIRHGWLDSLQEDLEAEDYACAAAVLPASGVGAPHKRDRLWIVAYANDIRHERNQEAGRKAQRGIEHAGSLSMAYSEPERLQGRENQEWQGISGHSGRSCATYSMGDTEYDGLHGSEVGRIIGSGEDKGGLLEPKRSDTDIVADTISNEKHQKQQRSKETERGWSADKFSGCDMVDEGFWNLQQLVYCRDGKHRPIPTEPALFPLANGIPNRVGILRGAGNAIVPQVAAEIIKPFV